MNFLRKIIEFLSRNKANSSFPFFIKPVNDEKLTGFSFGEESENKMNNDNNEKKDDKQIYYIICNNQKIPIDAKTVLFTENEDWKLPDNCFGKWRKQNPINFVCHHDACFNSKMCFNVLKQRGLSVSFLIDNDGTIYQLCDTQRICFHAVGVNSWSIGVEVSNAVDLKYKDKYNPERPIIENKIVHGVKLKPFLGFYDCQLEALKKLIKTVCSFYNIPLNYPKDENNKMLTSVLKDVKNFKGVIQHFHVNKNKIDAIGIDLENLLF
jgi:hypothetical protein